MITKQNNGFEFIELISLKETKIKHYHPLAGSYAIIELRGKYLLCYNSLRRQWELPAGKREDGETPLECAKRELCEETGQFVSDLQFIGLARIKNILDEAEKYNPIYYSMIDSLQPYQQNEETCKIRLWDLKESVHIDQVDLAILTKVKTMNLTRRGSKV
jgi:8-oxo-dGTP diphosphatase